MIIKLAIFDALSTLLRDVALHFRIIFFWNNSERRHTQLFLLLPHAQIRFIFLFIINILLYYFILILLCSAFVMSSTACLSVCLSVRYAWVIGHMWTITNFICGDLLSECFCHRGSQHRRFWIPTSSFFGFPLPSYCDINRFDAISRPVSNKIYIFFPTIFL